MKNWSIDDIQNITYKEAQKNTLETIKIKDHDCFFVNFGDYFGYSVLVFRNGKHIYYANDYELHHKYKVKHEGKEALRQYYIDTMQNKLFTDAELSQSIISYDEYKRKDQFLRNYWIMQFLGSEIKRKRNLMKQNKTSLFIILFLFVMLRI